jgi:hypothetical protein
MDFCTNLIRINCLKSSQLDVLHVMPFADLLTRFNPGNAHVCRLSNHGALVGSGEVDGDQTKAERQRVLPRFGPLGRVTTYVLLV